ncbi:MAG: ATP-dependent DNA helicase RecG [Nitrospira sp. CG24A]|nr:MAG: ATP-dependent DNA helicase RecG [Nitrospira sp. CG24A]
MIRSATVIRRSSEPNPSEQFQQWLDRVARPIEFATRDAFTHLPTVKNLSHFVSSQVMQALSSSTYPRAIEAALFRLRELFLEDQQRLPVESQQRRLQEAMVILRVLRKAVHNPTPTRQEPEPIVVRKPVITDTPLKPWWAQPIRFARGVGPKRTSMLQRFGIETVEDAFWTLPWRYEDRSVMTPIGQLVPGVQSSICGTIVRSEAKRARSRRLTILDIVVEDSTGRLQAVFFNQPFLEALFTVGTSVMLTGRMVTGAQGWVAMRMEVAQYEVMGAESEALLHVGRIVPVYHETKGWTSRQMRALMKGLLDVHAAEAQEVLPFQLRARYRLLPIQQAIQDVHFPQPGTDGGQLDRGLTPAHRRLAFEELFVLQLALASRHRVMKEEVKQVSFNPKTPLLGKLDRALSFQLTEAQARVIREILSDMTSSKPMNRLVQGDVGSGKTIVAVQAMVLACGSGYQAALMAPTEILAEQHYRTMKSLLEPLGLSVVLVSGGGRAVARKAIRGQVASGTAQVVIGTHAVIQQGITFAKLGLAVVDEQHRFGVLQRKTLIEKGYKPDVLVLTATPIPRTLAMTVYGDLDVSVIDEMPPGRKPVRTFLLNDGQRGRAYQILRDELRSGRQAYIVYPLVEESEKTDLQAAMQGAEQLKSEELAEFRVGLLHGRMKSDEKEQVMASYKKGAIQVLVSTTVVEVGVDVPNATVMMIEHAERFGLAQLHQLRGRVGRSGYQSYCLLMASGGVLSRSAKPKAAGEPPSAARERLEALVRSTDGFVIAEEDLRIRGPGEFFGFRQWGLPEFRVASLVRDVDILQQARQEAFALLKQDPQLKAPVHRVLREAMLRRWESKLDLGSVS